ncbi:restriction endonuclease subunit S [Marinobacter algicola]|uniref:restriction endonuclease subunit S n=1 Tax=Marinobacter algicola TaxID=236100 RepID=UPI003BAB254B
MVAESPIPHPDDWPVVTLSSICTKIGSGATPKGGQSTYLNERIKYSLVRSQNVFDRHFSFDGLAFISNRQASELKSAELKAGDLLLNITGDGITFARACQVPNSVLPACVNQHVSIIRPDQEIADSNFILSFLTHPAVKPYIESFNAGGSRRAITKGHIESFELPLPPLETQVRIGEVLSALDQKIALNHQINTTLESMTQALFKSWFVDFDPVIDNALAAGNPIPEALQARADARAALGDQRKPLPDHIRQQFPDRFVQTEEMGWVPQGWEVTPFGQLLEQTIGGDWGKEEEDEKHTLSVAIIRGTDIPSVRSGIQGKIPYRWVEPKKFATRKLIDGDIVLEVSGGSPSQPTGRAVYVTDSFFELMGTEAVPASFCRKFRPKSKPLGLIGALHLDLIYREGKTWNYQNQSTGISNFQTKVFLSNEMLAIPEGEELLEHFFHLTRPMIDKIRSCQNLSLAKLRDTLLPKLLSGELRVPEAEKRMEEVI